MWVNDDKEIIVVGDRLLVSPSHAGERTDSGLYLPDSAANGKQISGGWVEAVGPGYPVPKPVDPSLEEPWKQSDHQEVQYFPLQARKGDYVMYIRKAAYEMRFESKKYFIVPNSAVLVLLRDQWKHPGDIIDQPEKDIPEE